MAKYKIYNPNRFPFGMKLMDGVREVIIPPSNGKIDGFIVLDEEEIYYLNSISPRAFKERFVYTENELMENMGYLKENYTILSDEDIEKILKGNIMKMKSKLKKMEGKHVFDKIIQIAKNLDLPLSKMQIIEEITGIKIIEE